jgi:hypothetical protein
LHVHHFIESTDMTQAEAAEIFERSKGWVSNMLSLARIPLEAASALGPDALPSLEAQIAPKWLKAYEGRLDELADDISQAKAKGVEKGLAGARLFAFIDKQIRSPGAEPKKTAEPEVYEFGPVKATLKRARNGRNITASFQLPENRDTMKKSDAIKLGEKIAELLYGK